MAYGPKVVTLLDTSILIDFLVDESESERIGRLLGDREAAISAISVFELLAGVTLGKHLTERKELVELTLVMPVTSPITERAAELFRVLREQGITVDNEDLLIAATALDSGIPVLTRNYSHFRHIPELEMV